LGKTFKINLKIKHLITGLNIQRHHGATAQSTISSAN